MAVIEAHHLSKIYGRTTAVEDLSFHVLEGEAFGFLGPNGAGKTTTVKMLLGLARPSAGTVRVLGFPPGNPQAMAGVGFLPEHFRFPLWMTAFDFLEYHARLHRVEGQVRNQRIQDLLGRVGLDGRGRDRLGTFSKGMMQRVGLAQALISRPRLVVLDEPTSGLDPLGRRYVRDVIRMLRDESVTVFLNSHQLGEVEAVCDRVAILNLGRLIGLGSIDELTGGELLVEVHAAGITPEILAGIERLARLEKVEADRLYLGVEQEALLPQIAACLHDGGARLYRLAPRRPSLEDLFVRLLEAE